MSTPTFTERCVSGAKNEIASAIASLTAAALLLEPSNEREELVGIVRALQRLNGDLHDAPILRAAAAWEDQVVDLVKQGRAVDAVRLMREKACCDLTIAKRVVCDNWDMTGGGFSELAARCESARAEVRRLGVEAP